MLEILPGVQGTVVAGAVGGQEEAVDGDREVEGTGVVQVVAGVEEMTCLPG